MVPAGSPGADEPRASWGFSGFCRPRSSSHDGHCGRVPAGSMSSGETVNCRAAGDDPLPHLSTDCACTRASSERAAARSRCKRRLTNSRSLEDACGLRASSAQTSSARVIASQNSHDHLGTTVLGPVGAKLTKCSGERVFFHVRVE